MERNFAPKTPNWRARIETAFASPGMMQSIDARIDQAEPGRVALSCPIAPQFRQQHGFAHAGLTFTLGDTAAGFAAQSLMAETDGVMTIELKINLMAPGAGERLLAIGQVERAGKRITVVRADVFAQTPGTEDAHIATLLGTMMAMQNMA